MHTFHIRNMTCGGCVSGVTRAIHAVDPAAQVHGDAAHRKIEIISNQPLATLQAALTKAGYQAQAVGVDS
jgi:copper chaperone